MLSGYMVQNLRRALGNGIVQWRIYSKKTYPKLETLTPLKPKPCTTVDGINPALP